jgi:hypothetical protein
MASCYHWRKSANENYQQQPHFDSIFTGMPAFIGDSLCCGLKNSTKAIEHYRFAREYAFPVCNRIQNRPRLFNANVSRANCD